MARDKRKLVTVRRVADVRPITGADLIETVVVDGWTCVCKKNEHKPGELALFFEIDSFLPASDERWNFLSERFSTYDDAKGFRVKTIKLKGQMSQGILKQLLEFPEVEKVLADMISGKGKEEAEKDVLQMSFEEMLGVKKWDSQLAFLSRARSTLPEDQMAVGLLPECIQKTDQERIQNLPGVFDDWKDEVFQESTKMDGSSMTVYFIRSDSPYFGSIPTLNPTGGLTGDRPTGRVGVCSRNLDLVERPGNLFWDTALKNKLPEKLESLGRNVAIQGELCGTSIQKNFEGFPAGYHDFYLFATWDIDEQKYLAPREVQDLAKQLRIKHVPVHGFQKLHEIATDVDGLLRRAEGKGINGKKREGIVLKHEGGRFGFKAISNSYLLKHGE